MATHLREIASVRTTCFNSGPFLFTLCRNVFHVDTKSGLVQCSVLKAANLDDFNVTCHQMSCLYTRALNFQ